MFVCLDILYSLGIVTVCNIANFGFGVYVMGTVYNMTLLSINADDVTFWYRLSVMDIVYTIRD